MNFKTKLAVLAIGAAMGSMAFNASACSTVIVGKDASATGNILVGHNEDNGCHSQGRRNDQVRRGCRLHSAG